MGALQVILEEIDPNKPFSPHFDWSKGRSSNCLTVCSIIHRSGDKTTDYASTIEKLLRNHFPVKSGEDHHPVQYETGNLMHELGDDDPEFTQQEIKGVFRSLNRGKAPGVDDYTSRNN